MFRKTAIAASTLLLAGSMVMAQQPVKPAAPAKPAPAQAKPAPAPAPAPAKTDTGGMKHMADTAKAGKKVHKAHKKSTKPEEKKPSR
ncbi:MAG: hypothetical protein ACOY71_11075 [Gemmatimonadota bacterium]